MCAFLCVQALICNKVGSSRRTPNRYYTNKTVTCRNCDKLGHLSKNCPAPKVLRYPQSHTATTEDSVTKHSVGGRTRRTGPHKIGFSRTVNGGVCAVTWDKHATITDSKSVAKT